MNYENPQIAELSDDVKEYVKARVELLKLETAEQASKAYAKIWARAIYLLTLAIFIIFISLAVSFMLSELFASFYLGFGVVALFYMALVAVFYFFRESVLERPVVDSTIKKIFDQQEDDDEEA